MTTQRAPNGITNGHNGFHSDSDPESPTTDSSDTSSDGLNGITNGTGSLKINPRKRMKRKQSSPMMPAFMVSAPGKVIMFGEHAVVHGKAAIAAAISLRSYLLVTTLSKSKRTVTLRFPDIDFDHTWNIDELPWSTFQQPSKKKYYYSLVTDLDPELVASIQPFLADVSPDKPSGIRKVHQNSAGSFLYMFLSLGSKSFPGCQYTLRSTIPIGAGLGSSATIAVCMSAALLMQLRALSGPHPDQPIDESRVQIERINRWAYVYEMFIHGNPSGVDNTVSTQGKAVVFQRTDYDKPPSVRPLWDFPELPLLLVDTRVPKSTAYEVAKVGKLKRRHPKLVGSILDAVDKVTEASAEVLTEEAFDTSSEDCLGRVGELMTINHGLLVSMGVSHPRLERVRELVDHEGIGWTKLTGAGGGGCSITLLKPGVSREKLDRLEEQLDEEGFQKFETTLGGDGVGVLWPAVLKNGMDEDDQGGMEIDLDNFLSAEGNEGVERLVGVHGGEGDRSGWKFWRVES
ncbi:mevalonate kinase [Staphylotrichum tortipilum]|uniref:Mevalonate kinase n=1 Tax=Staphylotrichum tortipilum TaxID=2831512 RepID=A0AAN6RRB8_9PEZI|nr:mevalonate kinase [Staphylotrichum longicolle]